MRKVDRTLVNPPPSLTGLGCRGEVELDRARRHFAQPDAEPFLFSAYKGADVVAALDDLFFGKCAYCESKFIAVTPVDVDHFRPKGAVGQCVEHRGYWWLAARWENLLSCCPECNRKRKKTIFEQGVSVGDLEKRGKRLSGKGDSFPILGPTYAKDEGNDLAAENPALIDPTQRDPQIHLSWLLDEEFCLISPRWNGDSPDPYGYAGEHTFGLNRQGLVEMRTALLLSLQTDVAHIERLLDMVICLPDPVAERLRDEAMSRFNALYDKAKPDQPYSSMVDAFMNAARERLIERYSTLDIVDVQLPVFGNPTFEVEPF